MTLVKIATDGEQQQHDVVCALIKRVQI